MCDNTFRMDSVSTDFCLLQTSFPVPTQGTHCIQQTNNCIAMTCIKRAAWKKWHGTTTTSTFRTIILLKHMKTHLHMAQFHADHIQYFSSPRLHSCHYNQIQSYCHHLQIAIHIMNKLVQGTHKHQIATCSKTSSGQKRQVYQYTKYQTSHIC